MFNEIRSAVLKIKETKPVILNLTNLVTMDLLANTLLAIGAAPIMSVDSDEFEELINISSAVNINIGTFDKCFSNNALIAAKIIKTMDKPLILDPVGCGASKARTELSRKLSGYATIIRGNASEIMALADVNVKSKGVEATNTIDEAKRVAMLLAKKNQNIVVVSGEKDFITDGHKHLTVNYGTELMTMITGMGCNLTAVIAAFRAVIADSFKASELAVTYFNLCGELTQKITKAPGTFRSKFIDSLFLLDFDQLREIYDKK